MKKHKLLGMSSSSYKLIIPDQDSVQIDTEDMWRAYLKCIRLLKDGKGIDLSKVVGISISSLCPGLAALDENGKVLVDPIIYSDRRSTEEAEIIKKVVGEDRLFEITANTAMAGADVRNIYCFGLREIFRRHTKKQNISDMSIH